MWKFEASFRWERTPVKKRKFISEALAGKRMLVSMVQDEEDIRCLVVASRAFVGKSFTSETQIGSGYASYLDVLYTPTHACVTPQVTQWSIKLN